MSGFVAPAMWVPESLFCSLTGGRREGGDSDDAVMSKDLVMRAS